jgi:hypothetical protein
VFLQIKSATSQRLAAVANTLIDYIAMGMDSYEILEFINAKIETSLVLVYNEDDP